MFPCNEQRTPMAGFQSLVGLSGTHARTYYKAACLRGRPDEQKLLYEGLKEARERRMLHAGLDVHNVNRKCCRLISFARLLTEPLVYAPLALYSLSPRRRDYP